MALSSTTDTKETTKVLIEYTGQCKTMINYRVTTKKKTKAYKQST